MNNNLLKDIDFKEETNLVVGCSAGPDSMALLHYLLTNTNKQLIVAHINHNVRKESKIEEAYLKDFCKLHNIIFETMTIEEYTENNFENEARKKRYDFYEKILSKYNAKYLFLAHHGDDLIETILMKIIRGSNLDGYAGIKKVSKIKNYFIVRPFLTYTKKDILDYNKTNKIKYYLDKSNEDETYTRNRYRKNILPILKKEDPKVHEKFLKYSNTLQEYSNYINYEIEQELPTIYQDNILNLDKFNKLHPFLKKNIIYYILNNLYNNEQNIIKEKNVTAIFKIIASSKPNLKVNLPKNLIVNKEYDKLHFTFNKKDQEDYCIEFQDHLVINNIIIQKTESEETDGNNICRLNSKNINFPLYIRNKKEGDYIETLGLNGKKKIKDIFIEKKIPLDKRNSYPLLVDSKNNIIWIPNIKKSKFNLKKHENYDIIIKYCEKEENDE